MLATYHQYDTTDLTVWQRLEIKTAFVFLHTDVHDFSLQYICDFFKITALYEDPFLRYQEQTLLRQTFPQKASVLYNV